MMNAPRARACFTTSFKGPAISVTRRAADLHQWSSHMSQRNSAVFFGSHVTAFSLTWTSPPVADVRERIFSFNGASAAAAEMLMAAMVKHRIDHGKSGLFRNGDGRFMARCYGIAR